MTTRQKYIEKAEDVADRVIRRGRNVLPRAARLCLIASFLEDGIRMFLQWDEQREYVEESWGCGKLLATLFVLVNLFGQLGGCGMVMARCKTNIAVAMLIVIVVLQILAYSIVFHPKFLMLKLALIGALLLVLAEARIERRRSLFAGLPSMGDNKPRVFMQLAGRVLLAFMFTSLLRFELSVWQVIQDTGGSILMLLVVLGYKTKLSSLVLVALLTVLNLCHNAWWSIAANVPRRDFLKYNFFQTLSVIGGLLMIVTLGPGRVSMDAYKKKW